MKKLKSLLKENGDAPDINPQKFAALVRMGLISHSNLPLIKRALEKNNPGESLSLSERGVIREMVNALIDQVMNNPMIYNKVRQNLASIHEDINGIDLELLKEADLIKELADLPKLDRLTREDDPNYNFKNDKNIPPTLIMKRKAIRIYPGNQKVALYYIQAIDRFVTIPFGGGMSTAIPSINEEQLDEISREKLLDYASAATADYLDQKKRVDDSIDRKTGIIGNTKARRKRDNRSKGLKMAFKKNSQLDEVSRALAMRAFEKRAAQAYDFGDDDSLDGAEKRVKASMKLDKQDVLMRKPYGARYKAGTEDSVTGEGELNIVRPWAGDETWRAAGARAVQNIKNEKKARIKKANDNSVTKLKGVKQKVGLDPIQGGWEGVGDLAVRGVVGGMKLLYKGVKKLGEKKPVSEQRVSHYHFTYAKNDPDGLAAVEKLRKDSKGTHVVKQRGRGPRDQMKADGYGKYASQSYVPRKYASHFDVYTYPRDTQNMNRALEKEKKEYPNNKLVSKDFEERNSYKKDEKTGQYGYKKPVTKMDEEYRKNFRKQLDEIGPLFAIAGRAVAGIATRAIGSKVATNAVKGVAGKVIKQKSTIDKLSKNIKGFKDNKVKNVAGVVSPTNTNTTPANSPSDTDLAGPKSVVTGKDFSGDRLAGSGVSVSGSRKMPTSTSQGDFISPTQSIGYRKQMVTPVMREDTQIDVIANLIEHNLEEFTLVAGKDKFKINNTVAKKILEVYEKMNRKNKIRMVEMLSESKESFNKIADFAINYTKRF